MGRACSPRDYISHTRLSRESFAPISPPSFPPSSSHMLTAEYVFLLCVSLSLARVETNITARQWGEE